MSLILYYRDCFTADTAINDELNIARIHYEKRPKTYLSKDKKFAAMACGMVPDTKGWEDIYDVISLYILGREKETENYNKIAIENLSKIFKHNTSTSSLIVAIGNYLLSFIYYDLPTDTISDHNPNIPFVHGSGEYAARMLINSKKELSQDKFFNIVSMADRQVSRSYTFIELNKVIGTPWYKNKHKKVK